MTRPMRSGSMSGSCAWIASASRWTPAATSAGWPRSEKREREFPPTFLRRRPLFSMRESDETGFA
ncbi:hypothetical protein BKA00_002531 [Actinomadura coerulea]|uniref:Uncharacterized protein n=1 Tax=Actinomadura coerulea TaxID=46159 RepID=A0A7X0FYT1_9ACTN|nr:hypothetical protein [Actinomadura coerulea]MBB6395617.1 hypothetical protein [Actinomadura coerulea]